MIFINVTILQKTEWEKVPFAERINLKMPRHRFNKTTWALYPNSNNNNKRDIMTLKLSERTKD